MIPSIKKESRMLTWVRRRSNRPGKDKKKFKWKKCELTAVLPINANSCNCAWLIFSEDKKVQIHHPVLTVWADAQEGRIHGFVQMEHGSDLYRSTSYDIRFADPELLAWKVSSPAVRSKKSKRSH